MQDLCGFSDSFSISIDPFVLETEINYDDSYIWLKLILAIVPA